MVSFSINGGNSATYTHTTPDKAIVIDFESLDNSFSIQINGVDLFVGGPLGAPNEAQFQVPSTSGQTVRFADGDLYEADTPPIWLLGNADGSPVVQLEIYRDGTISLSGIKTNNGPLEPLELFNGMTVNTAAIAAAWNDTGSNTVVLDQIITGPTNAAGDFDVLCFASGTIIETAAGPKTVDDLQNGDLVLTYDGDYQPVRWIGSSHLSKEQLASKPRLKPILIRADALGAGFPKQDLIVSPQHRVLVSSVIAKRMFDCSDVLIPANKLLPLPGVEVAEDSDDGIRYFHMLFDDHEIVWSNGTPTESLFPGPIALDTIPPDAKREILDLFPEFSDPCFKPFAARPIPEKGKRMRKLVERHIANKKPLFCSSHGFAP